MELTNEHEQLSLLICKELIGTISADEQLILTEWRKRNTCNETVYQRLTNYKQLQAEHQAALHTDYSRPLTQMRKQLGLNRQSQHRHWFIAAAVIAIMIAAGTLVWWHHYTKVVPPIIPNTMQIAMKLSRENGRQEAEIKTMTPREVQTTLHQLADQKTETSSDIVRELLEAKRITTWEDKEYWLQLADGTYVHLNYNTRMIYPERFIGATRDVVLDGEAYFMVAKDLRHPFIVHTPGGCVQVYGTEFNVNTRCTDNSTEIVLVSGAVSVTPTNGTEQLMQPGQKCLITDGQVDVTDVDPQPYIAWNTGVFVFTDTPLETLLQTVGHWYRLEIEYTSPSARQLRFTGTIDRYGSADAILHSISKVTGLGIEQHGNHIIIK